MEKQAPINDHAPPASLPMIGNKVIFGDQVYELINTRAAFNDWISLLRQKDVISLDTETIPDHPKYVAGVKRPTIHGAWDLLAGVALSVSHRPDSTISEGYSAGYIPRIHAEADCVDDDYLRWFMHDVLYKHVKNIVGHNLIYDLVVLSRYGMAPPSHIKIYDTHVMYRLLNPDNKNQATKADIDTLALRYYDYSTIKFADVVVPGVHTDVSEPPIADVVAYAAEDASVTGLISRKVIGDLSQRPEVSAIHKYIEQPLIFIVADMCGAGVLIDTGRLNDLREVLDSRRAELQEQINQEAGREINVMASRQLAQLLYEERGNDEYRRTKNGNPSTDKRTLLMMSVTDPLAGTIGECRKMRTYLGMIDGLTAGIKYSTGRIYPNFKQSGTETGRFSSNEPNLQNVPSRDEVGDLFRDCIIAPPGHQVVAADYSQIEYRILASMSGDVRLIAAYLDGEDLHSQTAAMVLGINPEEVTKGQRAIGKKVNFSAIYGQSAREMAAELKRPLEEVEAFQRRYWEQLPAVNAFRQQTINACYDERGIHTLYGRWRPLPDIRAYGGWVRRRAERQAVNTVIQGTAADILKMAMIAVSRLSPDIIGTTGRMVMSIHDELVFEIPDSHVEMAKEAIRQAMVEAVERIEADGMPMPEDGLCVPLEVDVGAGPSWGSAK